MLRKSKILAFSGSSRKGSFNATLLANAAGAARSVGAEVTIIDLRSLALPIYDGDYEIENGVPASVRALRTRMIEHDGFLVASPEYNGSVSALLKNALDWCSRPSDGVEGLAAYRGKTVALLSASSGPFGGVRGLLALRSIMAKMGCIVLAEDLAVPFAQNAFDASGVLSQPATMLALQSLASNLIKISNTLHIST